MRGWWARWRGPWGIRGQLTVLATLVVTLPLILGALIITALLDRVLTDSLVTSTVDEARRMAAVVAVDPDDAVGQHTDLAHGMWLQVVDASGAVVASAPRPDPVPRSTLRPAPGAEVTEGVLPWWTHPNARTGDIITAVGFERGGQPHVVLVGSPQAGQLQAAWTAAVLLLAGVPVFMLGTALATWWFVGRALDPVVEIRRQVERITAQSLSERVPTPPTQDEVGRLARTMNAMLARLQASQESQARFVADASHELRSPLTTLAGALEIAGSADDDRTWRELAPLMTSETARLSKLVKDLLLLSRTDEGGLVMRAADVDLDDLAWAEVRRLREAGGGVRVVADIQATRVVGDELALSQVLRNLVDNAVRHARTQVGLSVRPAGEGGAVLVVTDDGAGIAEADRERVFERFVRLDDSRSRDLGGSGLGLPIVAAVTRAHGGTVRADAAPSGGARFTVRLPEPPAPEGRRQGTASNT